MELVKPVQIVTVQKKTPLYKRNELAERIELINLEELGFDLVAGKDLYQVGDKAVFIQPDYCLSDIPLFESFIRPNGDESKSMLGKVEGLPRRIRAKKFTLSKEPNGDPVYSNGILLPYIEVHDYLNPNNKDMPELWKLDLTKKLGITKYEEPEIIFNKKDNRNFPDGFKGNFKFPEGIYKTDEENINNLWNHIEKKIGYPITLVGTEKVDGSSITIGITPKIPEGFICSRNMQKPLFYNKCVGVRNKTFIEKLLFWKKHNLKIYERVPNDQDDFVKYGKPYLDKLIEVKFDNVVFRGELNGSHLKGSGNKNNPARLEQPNIKFFGMDRINNDGIAIKVSHVDFVSECNVLGFPTTKQIFVKEFNTFQEIIDECNEYFKTNMIEGIVVRSLDSKFSAKVMNLEYDSKK